MRDCCLQLKPSAQVAPGCCCCCCWDICWWLTAVYDMQQPMEISSEQTGLASRVLEAAVRASRDHTDIPARAISHAKVLQGMALALFTCGPRHLPAASQEELYSQPSRASRCSLLVSVAKELERRAALDSIGPCLLPNLAGVTTATVVPIYGLADQLQEGSATPEDLPFLAGPASTAWLFAGGRMLVAFSQLLQLVPVWLVRPLTPQTSEAFLRLVSFAVWLVRIKVLLAAMKYQLEGGGAAATATPAAAAATSIKAVTAAESKVAALLQVHRPLFEPLMDAERSQEEGGSSSLQLAAAFDALSAACSEPGSLPAAVAAVGESLCAAFPQRFACNNRPVAPQRACQRQPAPRTSALPARCGRLLTVCTVTVHW